MSRFRQIEYDAQKQSVVVGAGLKWDDVYAALDLHNVTVVGGRVSGVGVAGFTLGGGKFDWQRHLSMLTRCLRLLISV
jgi:FAD/FMN-containing dehydrogenase